MDIPELVLAHFQQVLQDIQAGAKQVEYRRGRPPSSLVVEQRQASPDAYLNLGITMRRWRVTRASVSIIVNDEQLPPQNRDGMFYDYGKAHFAIFEDTDTVRVGWVVGPRYGRGYDLPVELVEGEPVRFGTPRMLWES